MARKASPARLVIALSVAGVLAVFLLYTSIAGGGNPSLAPSELAGRTGDVQLAGLVVGPVRGDAHDGGLRFRLKDISGESTLSVVVLYSGRDYFSLVSIPDWAAGVFDGKIRVSVDAAGGDGTALAAVLAHELAHAFLRSAAADRTPGWLHEGYAQWSSGRRLPRRELSGALSGSESPTAAALEARLRGPLDRGAARALYAQTLSLVEYLVGARGEGALACVVARLSEGARIDAALREETDWSEEEFFESWRRWAGLRRGR